jgi:diaminobutyrate-2-oxoglutarate transaminase
VHIVLPVEVESMPLTDTFDRLESRVRSYSNLYPNLFDRAQGAEMWDVEGTRYLDFLSGCGSLNYGHNNPVLKRALLDYIESDAITHGLDLHTVAKEAFLRAFSECVLEPLGMDHVVQFTGPTGTNAVEAALKIARRVTGRVNVVSFSHGFHGVTMGSLAATTNSYHRVAAGLPMIGTTVMPYDGTFGTALDTADYLDWAFSDPGSGVELPAAIIVETVQGEGGLNVARSEWLRSLRAICDEREILLIIDDIQAGCGRTGRFLSFEEAEIEPDIVTLSKSLSGYGLPLAVTVLRRSIDRWLPGEHNGTFRGNNHAFVTATAALDHFWRTEEFSSQVRAKSEWLGSRLREMADEFAPHVVEARGRGLMQGLCFADPDRARAVAERAYQGGLIIERAGPHDEVVKCMPPLTIDDCELSEGLDILLQACRAELGSCETVHLPDRPRSVPSLATTTSG